MIGRKKVWIYNKKRMDEYKQSTIKLDNVNIKRVFKLNNLNSVVDAEYG